MSYMISLLVMISEVEMDVLNFARTDLVFYLKFTLNMVFIKGIIIFF